jgi:sulfur carrier protein ThiS
MRVRVKFLEMPELLPVFEDGKEYPFEFSGDTVEDLLLHHIFSKIDAEKKSIFFNDRGEIVSELLVLINGGFVSRPNWVNQKLQEGDFIEFVPAPG